MKEPILLKMNQILSVLSSICLFTALGQSATLASSGALSTADGFVSNPQTFVYGTGVTFGADSVITGLNWFGAYKNTSETYAGPDAFSISLYAIQNGVVSLSPTYTLSDLSVSKALTGLSMPWDYHIFEYTASVNTQPIRAGNYVLSITNDTPQSDLWLWSWTDCQTCGNYLLFNFENGLEWLSSPSGPSLTFDIFDNQAASVPEPNAAGSLCIAAALLFALHFFKRKTSPLRRDCQGAPWTLQGCSKG